MNTKTAAIIVAGGTGSRMGSDIPKQFLQINNKEIIEYTLETFLKCSFIDKIVIVCHKDYISHCNNLISAYNSDICVVCGGDTRQQSVFNGLQTVTDFKYVLIHDAVRCLVSADDIKKLHDCLMKNGSCTLAVKVKDTIKMSDSNNNVVSTVPREFLWQIQTPQAFETDEIILAHKHAISTSFAATDDCSVIENYGKNVMLVDSSYENIKITTPSDLKIAEICLKGSE